LFVVAWGEAHLVSGVAFVEEVGFSEEEVEEGADEALDAADLLADGEVKFVESLLVHRDHQI
jgi:hypothetical protein